MGKRILILLSLATVVACGLGCRRDQDGAGSAAQTKGTSTPTRVADTTNGKRTPPSPATSPRAIVPVEQRVTGASEGASPFNPLAEEHWPNGQLKFQTAYIGDSTEGRVRATFWYEDGQKQREEEYLRMRKEGPFITWYKNGAVEYQGRFRNNQIQDTCWYYWENGRLKQVAIYNAGLKNGPYEQYFETGGIEKKGSFLNDKADGPYTAYFPDGVAEFKGQYKDGLMEGVWEKYFENGRLKARAEYKTGKKEGRYQQWDELGGLMFDDVYHNDQRVVTGQGK
jgi:antitoxin component YwqK of YwqJK toxin-antitoxin module